MREDLKQNWPLKGFNLAKQSIQSRQSYLEKARSKAIDLARVRPTYEVEAFTAALQRTFAT